ncbi:phosphotransferase [Pseudonocardia sp. CA-107938]|uniref:phosphotransferase n=1 Tax=Pseudonocardia sp. CA-107938 TaxID=3240021 RepID=UPI003D89B24D
MDAARIAELFDLGARPVFSAEAVATGRLGAVRLLETADGRWAVKTPTGRWDLDDVGRTSAFQEAAQAHGVAAPRIRRTVDGAVVAVLDGRQVRVHEWLDLAPPDPLADPAQVGTVLGRLHTVPAGDPGDRQPWYEHPVGPAGWDGLVVDLQAAGAPFAGALAALRDELVALESWLGPPTTLRLCHRDLWADNLRRGPDGQLHVIDWDNSGAADPAEELAMVLFEYGRTDPARARALVDAYEAAGGPGRIRGPRQFGMLVAILGHIIELAGRNWLAAAPGSPEQADAEAWIRESLDDPHTRARLHELIGVAGRPS